MSEPVRAVNLCCYESSFGWLRATQHCGCNTNKKVGNSVLARGGSQDCGLQQSALTTISWVHVTYWGYVAAALSKRVLHRILLSVSTKGFWWSHGFHLHDTVAELINKIQCRQSFLTSFRFRRNHEMIC